MEHSDRPGSQSLRLGRVSLSGQLYLLTTRTKDSLPVLSNESAARLVLDCVRGVETEGLIRLTAVVVMPDHMHLVAELCRGELGTVMQSLKGRSSRAVNRLLDRSGSLWQAQYHDHAVRRDEVLRDVVEYCLNNPVRAGLVRDFHDYPFWWCRWEV